MNYEICTFLCSLRLLLGKNLSKMKCIASMVLLYRKPKLITISCVGSSNKCLASCPENADMTIRCSASTAAQDAVKAIEVLHHKKIMTFCRAQHACFVCIFMVLYQPRHKANFVAFYLIIIMKVWENYTKK